MRADGDLTLEVDSLESLSIVRFQVSDRGPGIPPEMRAKVVEPFFTTKGGGTGLGLAIAEGIVQGHRGRLEISDRPGGGAVVSIDLPAA